MTTNLARLSSPRHDDAAGADEPDALDLLGPAWSSMTEEQRRLYGGAITIAREDATTEAVTYDAIRDLIDVALRFPGTVRYEGLQYVAQRWCRTDTGIALAARLAYAIGPVTITPDEVQRMQPRARDFVLRVVR